MQFNAIVRTSALSCALLTLLACSESSSLEEQVDPANAVPVRVAEVSLNDDSALLYFAGVARSRQRATLSFQVGGVVSNRPVQIGQPLAADQLVATLYNPQLAPAAAAAQARLVQLQSDLQQSQRELMRLEKLHQRGLLAIQSLEQQQAIIESQNAAIDNAVATLQGSEDLSSESILRAPFSGVVESVLLEPGEFAQPGQPVVRIVGIGSYEVEIRVPPHMLASLAIGDTLAVRNSLSGQESSGTISEISTGSSGYDPLLAVLVSLADGAVQSGEALEVAIARERREQLSVPLSSVMRSAAGLSVFKMQDGRAHRTLVEVDKITGERAYILSGSLHAGEQVVYAGISRLAEGDEVEVLQ